MIKFHPRKFLRYFFVVGGGGVGGVWAVGGKLATISLPTNHSPPTTNYR